MRTILAVLVLAMFALAGCTDSGGDAMGPEDGGDGGASGIMPAGEHEPTTHHIDIKDFAFGDESLTILQGDIVVWTNKDGATHTVDSTDGGPLDSGNIAADGSFSFTFDDAGTFAYRCDIHTSMAGEIVVESLAAA